MNRLVYRLLLHLYPAEIRVRWGEDMVDVFEQQLGDGWWEAWFHAGLEIFQVALPRRMTTDVVMLSCVSASVSGALFFGLIWALGNSLQLLSLSRHLFAKLGG